MESFSNTSGVIIAERMIEAVRENKQYLSDIDGAIGDGDHGINMNKGFTMAGQALEQEPGDLAHALKILARVLMMRIGGSMGPLYGKMFKTMSGTFSGREKIDGALFGEALSGIKVALEALSPARTGDKTMVDALYPGIDAYNESYSSGAGFRDSLLAMKVAAEKGRDATRDMVAKLGRSSRLGERSRGVVDAGAASSALLLGVMADTIGELLSNS